MQSLQRVISRITKRENTLAHASNKLNICSVQDPRKARHIVSKIKHLLKAPVKFVSDTHLSPAN